MAKVDIKLLAKELNVSTSTVSRALNDSYSISETTKQKVRNLAEKLNYQPNPYAKSLVQKSSRTIAVIIPDIENSFFSSCIDGINAIATNYGYHVLIYLTHEDHEQELSIVKSLLNGRVDGLLISVSKNTVNADHLKKLACKIPVVFFDRIIPGSGLPSVNNDDFESGFAAARHLIDNGAKKLLYLGLSTRLSTDRQRKEGFLQALNGFNSCTCEEIYFDQVKKSYLFELFQEKYQQDEGFDGIFASSENLVFLCYEFINKLSLKIPDDVKILGFSNSPSSAFLRPSLTTITQPAREIGLKAAEVLFTLMKGKDTSESYPVSLKSRLLIRESTGCVEVM